MDSIHPRSAVLPARPSLAVCIAVLAAGSILVAGAGCNQSSDLSGPGAAPSGGEKLNVSVAVVKPERTTLRRTVRQPGSIQAFEQTPVFSKLAGYVRKWHVDMGDHVKKGEALAELWVPEMEVEVKQKEALVQQAEAEIKQAKETAAAAEASLKSAEAKVKEAEAGRLRAQAEYRRTKSQSERLARVGSNGVIDKEAVEETRYGFEAAEAGVEEVEARVKSAQATRDESAAKLSKARADVSVAEAHLAVAKENHDQARTLLEYATLKAPYDGVVTRRNVNTGDFVQPATGTKAEPLYIIERRDTVRILVEVPEGDAAWVTKGVQARIRVQVLKGHEFAGTVDRTSYALDRTARTLIAEIDLPNPKDQLRPGMYVLATITAEHPDAMTIPASAVMTQGDVTQGYQSYCFLVVDGKTRRTLVELGVRGNDRIEVLKKQARPGKSGEEGAWEDFTGQEVIVRTDLSALGDGQPVTVVAGAK
jgi:multidrug efflux pump subunit AcrA (membrane-fusion protein)